MRVMVSGCFDTFHAGHVRFLEEAAAHGELYVCVGSDATIEELKGRPPVFTELERLYLVKAVRHVKKATVSRGSGMLDFAPEIEAIAPDALIVNQDGDCQEKLDFCIKHGIGYVVLERTPAPGLPARESSALRALPYRVNLAGGWLDQTWVSHYAPGPVVVANIMPTHPFDERSGMATSTRATWQYLHDKGFRLDDHKLLASMLFAYENLPGVRRYLSGSQDHIGLTYPGINALYYDGDVWPHDIKSLIDSETCEWLEQSIALVQLGRRTDKFDPIGVQRLSGQAVMKVANASERCWQAILAKDIKALGQSLTDTHQSIVAMLPGTTNVEIEEQLAELDCYGATVSGAGGGGYMVVATDEDVPDSIRIKVRRG